jgi:hypothetical protein
MSETSIKFAFALFLVFASLAASFARHASLAQNVPIPTTGSSRVGNCFQAEHNRAIFVHPDGVCWAPQNTIDEPGV